jgi:REP element-mobilizing transposase RayT
VKVSSCAKQFLMSTASFRRYEYRRRLPRYQRDERSLSVTFRTSGRFTLSSEARTLVLQHCFHDNGKIIHLHAVAVMPDHVHLLLAALRDADGWTLVLTEILRAILRAIKGSSARSVNKLASPGWTVVARRILRSRAAGNETLRETIEHIRQNPARRGLVDKPESYECFGLNVAASRP